MRAPAPACTPPARACSSYLRVDAAALVLLPVVQWAALTGGAKNYVGRLSVGVIESKRLRCPVAIPCWHGDGWYVVCAYPNGGDRNLVRRSKRFETLDEIRALQHEGPPVAFLVTAAHPVPGPDVTSAPRWSFRVRLESPLFGWAAVVAECADSFASGAAALAAADAALPVLYDRFKVAPSAPIHLHREVADEELS